MSFNSSTTVRKEEMMKRVLVTFLAVALGFCAAAYHSSADDLSVTVYNNDLAVVRDTRDMAFSKGTQTKTMTDVPERIDPTSVRFAVEGGGVDMIEQNYRYDLVNSQKVLRRYIDSAISIRLKEGDLIEGVLQSVAGDVVISTAGGRVEIVRLDAIERFSFPELPEGLITRPTLFWKLTSDRARTAPAEISYMSSGFEWHAEYTVVIAADEKSMDMTSWVSVHNNSGATYENADLKLVAGDVHRVRQPQIMRKDVMMAAEQERAGGFEERGLFEYHLYDLQGQTTLQNAEIKQIALFPETMAKVKKVLVFDARKQPDAVTATVEFTNSEKDGLGIPLPAGKVRVYSRDERRRHRICRRGQHRPYAEERGSDAYAWDRVRHRGGAQGDGFETHY